MLKKILNKIFKNRELQSLSGKITMYTLALSSYILMYVFVISDEENIPEVFRMGLYVYLIINLPILSFYLLLTIIDAFRISKNDESILFILYNFLRFNEFSDEKILNKFENFFPKISKKKLIKFFSQYQNKEISIYAPCKHLSTEPSNIRLYAVYFLFDIASDDKIYTIKEEDYIEEISKLLKLPKKSYQYIKSVYKRKGLQEERKIIEEQNRKKLTESFLPYNAYKILGITPKVSKAQLKKVYRTLAKKYHPDKFHGQSKEIIEKAEDKFQEILEAYEIIIKYKQ